MASKPTPAARASASTECTCDLGANRRLHTAECDQRWDTAARAEMAIDYRARVRMLADDGFAEAAARLCDHVDPIGPNTEALTDIWEDASKLDFVEPGASGSTWVTMAREYRRYVHFTTGGGTVESPAAFDYASPAGPNTAREHATTRNEAAYRRARVAYGADYRREIADLMADGYDDVADDFFAHADPIGPGLSGAAEWEIFENARVQPGSVWRPDQHRELMARNYRHHFTSFPMTWSHWAFDYPTPGGPDSQAWGELDAVSAERAELLAAHPEAMAHAAALRALADIVEAVPSAHRYTTITGFFASDRAELGRITRAALAAGATVEKAAGEHNFTLTIGLGPLKVSALASRGDVCERVVTATETVTRSVPDPAYIAEPVPTVEITETVETVEWRCSPLLAE